MAQLDLWPDEVAALPWGGQSPRALAQDLVRLRIELHVKEATCGVDKSFVRCRSREAQQGAPADAAQYQLCVSTSFK